MTPEQLAADCRRSIELGIGHIYLTSGPGARLPKKGFPRGELVCVTRDGSRTHRFNAGRLLAALTKHGLIEDDANATP